MIHRKVVIVDFEKKYEVGRQPGAPWYFVKYPMLHKGAAFEKLTTAALLWGYHCERARDR